MLSFHIYNYLTIADFVIKISANTCGEKTIAPSRAYIYCQCQKARGALTNQPPGRAGSRDDILINLAREQERDGKWRVWWRLLWGCSQSDRYNWKQRGQGHRAERDEIAAEQQGSGKERNLVSKAVTEEASRFELCWREGESFIRGGQLA